ncbi:MraY family glycosyltransferase [Dactylosporangium sp. NPDC050588]|uniref:glycosyltransferase family 4 protein n=1 Tax=Dactylosporangium sp. NPDC050588 TaxID=3157211 RepID=UPI0033DE13A2
MNPPWLAAPVLAGLAAVPLAAVLTAVCRRTAVRTGIVDRPGGHKAHAAPTPYLGGLAVAAATLAPALFLVARGPAPAAALLLAVAAAAVGTLGLIDDLAPLSVNTRLVVEAGAAGLVALAGHTVPVTGQHWLDVALTVAWIVLLTNSFNLLDNMDGAAAATAAVTAVLLGVAATGSGREALWWCLGGACVGFLWHNRPPARIFLGDAGSLFVGFLIATGTVVAAPDRSPGTLAVPLLLALIAVVDTALVVVARRRAGRSWRQGGADHTSHRLRLLGLSAAQVAAALATGAALCGGLALLVRAGQLPATAGLGIAGLTGTTAVCLLLSVPTPTAPAAQRVR